MPANTSATRRRITQSSQQKAVNEMPDKKIKQDDPDQSKRFLEAAKEAGADETEKGAKKAFKAVVKPRKGK
jgi:hypothetical protein